jgi:hypothetical protein
MGSPEIMAIQLQHLIDLQEQQPNLTIQILPYDSGLNLMAGNDFTIFDLGEEGQLAATDGPFGVTHFDLPGQVASLSLDFGALTEGALSPRASIELIGAIAKEYRNGKTS